MSGLANAGLIAIDAGLRRWPGSPNGSGYVAAVTRLPQGFLDGRYANGLAVTYVGNHGGRSFVSVACRAPSGDLRAMARQWSPNALADGGVGNLALTATMASQELGEFCYALFTRMAPPGGNSPLGYSQHLVRFSQPAYVESRFNHPYRPGSEIMYTLSPTTMYIDPYPDPPFSLGSWNNAMHVSDTFPPRLWYVSGDTVIHWVDSDDPRENQAPFFYRWRTREIMGLFPGPPHQHGPWRIKFQGAHYIQRYFTSADTRGPILVRPWSNSSTDPELWYLVRDPAGFRIYRSSWRPGNWVLPPAPFNVAEGINPMAVIEDHGNGTYPQQNPHGYAFEHSWRKEDNLVGFLRGAPRGLNLLQAGIRIVRDARRIGQLYMIVRGGSNPQSGYFGGVYHAVSNDDGVTWGRLRRISPMPRSSGPGLVHGGSGDHGQGTVTRSGMVVLPGRGRVGGTNVRSLLVANPNTSGVADESPRPIVFRRRESKGAQWL